MWWEFEEEDYRVAITPTREDSMPRQLQESGECVGRNGEIQHWCPKDLLPQELQPFSAMTNDLVMDV